MPIIVWMFGIYLLGILLAGAVGWFALRWIRGGISGWTFLTIFGGAAVLVGLVSFANGRYVVLNQGLVDAGCGGNVDEIRSFLDLGADPNKPNEHLGYALPCAVRNGHVAAAKLLLEHGAKPYFGGFYGVARDLAAESDDPGMRALFGFANHK